VVVLVQKFGFIRNCNEISTIWDQDAFFVVVDVIDFAVILNCLMYGSTNVAFLMLLAFQHITYWKRC
jgi:hypothetical protein